MHSDWIIILSNIEIEVIAEAVILFLPLSAKLFQSIEYVQLDVEAKTVTQVVVNTTYLGPPSSMLHFLWRTHMGLNMRFKCLFNTANLVRVEQKYQQAYIQIPHT